MNNLIIAIIGLLGTVGIYFLSVKIHSKVNRSFTLPILISTIIIIMILIIFQIPYETYMTGAKWISNLLGPAVVALAYPLYMERHILKKLLVPILSGTLVGAFVGVTTGVLLAKVSGFSEEIIYTISSKSVTTPVSMAITEAIGGITPLAAVFVMIAGISGGVLSEIIFKYFHLHHEIGRGIALGSASHAIGTARALEKSQLEGSISSVAMIVSAIIVSMITPWLIAVLA